MDKFSEDALHDKSKIRSGRRADTTKFPNTPPEKMAARYKEKIKAKAWQWCFSEVSRRGPSEIRLAALEVSCTCVSSLLGS